MLQRCTTVLSINTDAAVTSLESMGFVANMVSVVIYFMTVMCMNLVDSSNTLTNFMGSAFLLSLLGGFISDTYLTRLNTSLLFGAIEVLVINYSQ